MYPLTKSCFHTGTEFGKMEKVSNEANNKKKD